MLFILLFGTPQLALHGRPLALERRKSRALLYYLAAHAAPLSRDALLTLFWPDHERAAAQHLLRTNLHALRKALGSGLRVIDDTLALEADSEVDVRTFEAQLRRPEPSSEGLSAALALYRGDFLAGFTLPDTPGFDDWAAAERERYRRLAMRGLAVLSRHFEAGRQFSQAIDALDRALALDPLQEDVQRAALRLHYLAGDRVGAIRRYEQLRRLLDDELGVPPMAETRALYDAIITDTLPPTDDRRPTTDHPLRTQNHLEGTRPRTDILYSGPSVAAPVAQKLPFTGRSAELATLRELISMHKLALVEGEPGIGKTRLIEEFMRAQLGAAGRAAPPLALSGAARELESALPYQPMIEALRSLLAQPDWPVLRSRLHLPAVWLAEAARLLPDLTTSATGLPPSAADESRLWEGVSQLLLALARERAVVLWLDDLQWADAATAGLLGYLVRRADAAAAPIAFLAAARAGARNASLDSLIQTLTREERLQRLALARLTAADTAALAGRLSPAQAGALGDWLTRAAEGNPYVLNELVREARERGLLRRDGTIQVDALAHAPIVPRTVYTLIQGRLARLSDAARRVLDAAVASGRTFEFEVVSRAAALSESAALDALDELRAAGLVYAQDGARYSFDHSLTIEVAYREMGEARHRLVHRRVAEAIQAIYRQNLDAVAGLLAQHFVAGGVAEQASPYAMRAGQRAAGLAAWAEAIAFFEQALEGADDAQRQKILMALGEARLQAGELARSSEAFQAALSLAQARGDAAGADEAQVAFVGALLPQARYAEAIAAIQELLSARRTERRATAEFLWGVALELEGTDLAGAAEHLGAAETLLRQRQPADPVMLVRIDIELGNIYAEQGDLATAVARFRAALTTAAGARTEAGLYWHVIAYNNLAYHLHLLGDPSAHDYATAGLALAKERGALGPLPFLHSTLGEIALAQSDLDSAERYFAEGLALAEQLATAERIAGLTANLGLVAVQRGDTARATQQLSAALQRAEAQGFRHLATQIRLWLAPLLPLADARVHLAAARTQAVASGRRRLIEEADRLEAQLYQD